MKRARRIEGRAITYYISAEGKNGEKIFKDDEDRLSFINLFRQQNIKNNLKFYAYVLLPKQYYCLVENYGNMLSKSMHRIHSDYANYFNRRYNRRNKLFKDRYSCIIIDKKNYLAEVSCYLHLLPKKNGVTKSLFKYKWSSLPGYINREKREDWVDYDPILTMFNGKSHKAFLNYQNYLKKNLKKQIASPFERLKDNIILGSEEFKKEVLKKQNVSRIAPQRDEDILARKIIRLAAQSPSWSSLKVKKKKLNHTILSRNAAIYFLKKYTDLSNQQISTYFKSLKNSSISQMSHRFDLIKEKNKTIEKISASLDEKI
ncbi:hypothetical protein LCGC14_0513340 [marine sediment metagenome]|uniref:Transposase IS200-like domain-containing protein n=1 Tax=marine sediment metagenome TaxID=412755 RepID=A0A0F9S5F0_9ZZZZ|nr:hypothetical protein [Candidatus Aminicenantes bacterium]